MTAETADVIIIGTGQAGVPLASKLAAAGQRVLIVERGVLGGTCVNSGCTPTKTMIASARAAHVARTAGRLGVRLSRGDGDASAEVRVDFPAVIARKNAVVQRWRQGIEKRLAAGAPNLTLLRGHARFVAEREIDVAGRRYRADRVVINVGARPMVPPIAGLDAVPWLDSHRVMDLPSLPEHLMVLGGGYVGCEMGQMFRRFGSRVTIIERAPHLLAALDDDVGAAITEVFRDEGITVEASAEVTGLASVDGGVAVTLGGGRELRGTHLLVASGRRPNTDDLDCDRAGIALDPKGFVVADDRYRTSADGIFAVGDAIDQPQFTHVAWDDHRLLFAGLMGKATRGRGERHIPFTIFTDPQIAGVGLGQRQARAKGVSVEVALLPFRNVARAIEVDELAGLIKVLIDPATEQIVGAVIVGAEAGELLHVFIALMQAKASARTLVEAEFVHPAYAEGLQSALMKLPRFSTG
ncbi:MAG TPA: mercuric reductase [Polyangia bacterium]|jgi:pyruvate/2-oxoglutarate dehydrogenase complex dihydrolipoamide dehydrogenase (E3) component|nr:mercuric reductase [Polyangia bacterium]